MAEILNLRRARKAKAKEQKDQQVQANRLLHATPKRLRNLAKARKEKTDQALSGQKLEKDEHDY
jgi:Domain of unknown function (DUF4169)